MSTTSPNTPDNENVAKKSIKRMDAVVTGVILGGIIASIYGVSKLQKKEETHHLLEIPKIHEKKSIWERIFGKK